MLRPLVHHETSRSWRSLLSSSGRGWSKVTGWTPTPVRGSRVPSRSSSLPRPHCAFNCLHSRAAGPTTSIDQPFPSLPSFEDSSSDHGLRGPSVDVSDISRLDLESQDSPQPDESNATVESKDSLRAELLNTLHAGDPELLLKVTIRAFRHRSLWRSLPATTIAQIFDSIRFEDVLAKYKSYTWLSPKSIASARKAGWPVRHTNQVFDDLLALFTTLFDDWLAAGQQLNLSICKSFLRLTCATGNADTARRLRAMAEQSRLEWDTEAYNLFLGSICWESAYRHSGERNLRVTEQSRSLRSSHPRNMPAAFVGHTTEVKDEAVDAFEEMVNKGLAADVQSFGLLMVAMGRVGDLHAVEGTLNRAWGVEVARVREDNTTALYFENDIPPDSPLYPTQDLLYYIAHIYGSNNDLRTALKLVDFISQKYSIDVSGKVAEELLRWSFILSTPRGGESARSQHKRELQKDLATGKVPHLAFGHLFELFLKPPYNVNPTLQMYNWRFASLRRQGLRKHMRALLRSLFTQSATLKPGARLRNNLGSYSIQDPQTYERTELENLNILASSTVLTRAVRLILGYNPTRDRVGVLTRWIPRFIGEWGNAWFNNTHRAFFYHVLSMSGLTFHRGMQEGNRVEMEIFATGKADRFIVRPQKPCPALPFCEKTQAQRRESRRAEGLAAGQNLGYRTPWEWYDLSDVQDWVWFSSGHGARVPGASFDLDTGHFIPNPETVKKLSDAETTELRERVDQQLAIPHSNRDAAN